MRPLLREVRGAFWPDGLAIRLELPRRRHQAAYQHFTGVDPKAQRADPVRLVAPAVNPRDERLLAEALMAHQHETRHFHQLIATSFGSYLFDLSVHRADFSKQFVRRIVGHRRSLGARDVPMPLLDIGPSDQLPPDLAYGKVMFEAFETQFALFESAAISRRQFVELWNHFTSALDEVPASDDDTTRFVRLASPEHDGPANPRGLSLTGILESAAWCEGIADILQWPLREETRQAILTSTTDERYHQLERLLAPLGEPALAAALAPRVAYIALQCPLTSPFVPIDGPVQLDDISPTLRAARIADALCNGELGSVDEFYAMHPDMVCAHFGWTAVSKMFRHYLKSEQPAGEEGVLDFVNGRRRAYFQFALSGPFNMDWPGAAAPTDLGAEHVAATWVPAFAAFDDEIVIQTDERQAGLAIALLANIAAEELLCASELTQTRVWANGLAKSFGASVEPAFRDAWSVVFNRAFDLEWSQFA